MKKIISAIIIICIIIIGFIAYKSMTKPTVKANATTLMHNSSSSNTQKTDTSTKNSPISSTSTNVGVTSNINTNASNSSNIESGQNNVSSNQKISTSGSIPTDNPTTTNTNNNSNTQVAGINSDTSNIKNKQNFDNNSSTNNSSAMNNNINNNNSFRNSLNSKISNYFGTYKISKTVGHSIEGVTQNYPSLVGQLIHISNNVYQLGNITINEPYYYTKIFNVNELFGADGTTGDLSDVGEFKVLIVSSTKLSSSQIQALTPDGGNPIIILYNSNLYVFGGGNHYSDIDETYKI